MTHLITKAATTLALVAVAALAAPTAAQASSIYPPTGSCQVTSAAITPGGQLSFACDAATFAADEAVTITITGENGSGAAVGALKFDVSTASGSARSNRAGALPATSITLPRNASGTYNITAVSATSAGSTATVTATNGAATGTSDGGALPTTGMNSSSLLAVWAGGGALVLAGGALAVAAMLRRRRNAED